MATMDIILRLLNRFLSCVGSDSFAEVTKVNCMIEDFCLDRIQTYMSRALLGRDLCSGL